MKCTSLVAVLIAAMALTGCSKDPQPAPTDTTTLTGAPAVQGTGETAAPVGGRLEVFPATFSLCEHPEGLIEVDVSWDANVAGSRWVQIFVESPTTARKLWASTPPEGKSRTGLWVRDATQFTLVDSDTGATLATARVTAVACGN